MIIVDDLCKEFERTVVAKDNETQTKRLAKSRKMGQKQKKESFYAVDHVSFQVPKGEILGILGPNGAGKTTLLRMLGALMQPTCGSVAIEDENGNRITDPVQYKKSIGYLSGNTKLYHRMSTREMLYMLADIYEIDKQTADERIEKIAEVLDMHSFIALKNSQQDRHRELP